MDFGAIATLLAAIIVIGLLLRFGKSTIGIVKAGSSGLTAETNALTLVGTSGGSSAYHGP